MPTDDWERGYADGWYAAMRQQKGLPQYGVKLADEMQREHPIKSSPKPKRTRKPSAYNKAYAKQYAILKKKHPRSKFAVLAKKAHRATKKVMK